MANADTPLIEVEKEQARLLSLQLDARLHEARQPILDAIQAGLDALEAAPPRLTVAANIRRHVAEVLSGSTTFLRLVLGSIIPTAVLLALLFQRVFSEDLLEPFNQQLWSLQRIALIGAFGGFVSILLRINDFAALSGSQINAQFYSGIFRPIIGAAFALLVFFVLKSGIVSSTLAASSDPAVTTSFFFAVSFLAGFSERLAPLIVTRTEDMFAPPRSDGTVEPDSSAPPTR